MELQASAACVHHVASTHCMYASVYTLAVAAIDNWHRYQVMLNHIVLVIHTLMVTALHAAYFLSEEEARQLLHMHAMQCTR